MMDRFVHRRLILWRVLRLAITHEPPAPGFIGGYAGGSPTLAHPPAPQHDSSDARIGGSESTVSGGVDLPQAVMTMIRNSDQECFMAPFLVVVEIDGLRRVLGTSADEIQPHRGGLRLRCRFSRLLQCCRPILGDANCCSCICWRASSANSWLVACCACNAPTADWLWLTRFDSVAWSDGSLHRLRLQPHRGCCAYSE